MKKIFNLSSDIRAEDLPVGILKDAAEVRAFYGGMIFPQFNVKNEDVSVLVTVYERGKFHVQFLIDNRFTFETETFTTFDVKEAIRMAIVAVHAKMRTAIKNGRNERDEVKVLSLIPEMANEGQSYVDPFDGHFATKTNDGFYSWESYYIDDLRRGLKNIMRDQGLVVQWSFKFNFDYHQFAELTLGDVSLSGKLSKYKTIILPRGILHNMSVRSLIEYEPNGFDGLGVVEAHKRQTLAEILALYSEPSPKKKEYSGTFDTPKFDELVRAYQVQARPELHYDYAPQVRHDAIQRHIRYNGIDDVYHDGNAWVAAERFRHPAEPIRYPADIRQDEPVTYTDLEEV